MQKISSTLFEKFSKLKGFEASDVQLEEINRDDFKFSENLVSIDLSRNKISRLDNLVFMHCKNLWELDLSRNRIDWIHEML